MTETREPVRLAGSALNRSCHVCAFFHSKEEEYRVLMPFIKDGFERGDRAFHVVDPARREEHLRRLERGGTGVAAAGRGRASTCPTPRLGVSWRSAAGRRRTSRTITSTSTA